MDSPSLIVIPPTPIRDHLPRTPHPSPTPTSKSSIPELTPSTTDRERSSSETTIVTIYSMYEEEEDDIRSWPASEEVAVVGHRHKSSKDVNLVAVARIPDYRHDSYLRPGSNGRFIGVTDEDSAFYDATYGTSNTRLSVVDKLELMRHSVASDASVQLAYTDSRPSSSYVRSSTLTSASGAPEHNAQRSNALSQRSSSFQNSRPNSGYDALDTHAGRRSHTLSPDPHAHNSPISRSSSRPTSYCQSPASSHRDYSTPNGRASLTGSSSSSASKSLLTSPSSPPDQSPSASPPTLPPSNLPSPSNPLSGRPGSSLLHVPVSPITPSSPQDHSSNSSGNSSIGPSEGEDPDAFHVRSTYAQLDQQGVKGDGYVEGVERTRARVGGSRTRDLTAKEIETLANLDRYGFFVTISHDRLILLPSSPFLKPLSRVTHTVPGCTPTATSIAKLPPAQPLVKETARIAKWNWMLQVSSRDEGGNIDEWGIKPSKLRKLRARTFKGIPDCWRSAAWEVLMNRYSRAGKQQLMQLASRYRASLDQPSTYDVQIDLDVPRTITGHIMFRTRYGQGQRSLFHVLHSLSLHCEECGYCQGMGPIAATLLCYFSPEKAYASLVRLHDSYAMHSIFSPGFPGLLEAIYVQERITEQMMPAVYAAFKKHMISTTSYATKWYITLFANSVPFQTQLRLWDAFLLEGPDIFVIVAVAVVWVYRDHITSDSANFESVLSLLSSFFVPEDENALLSWIKKVVSDKKLRSSMQQWRQDWTRLVSSGQHTQALL
ncbi:unnamed protein product [Somion occarium]|uniref:Rab-GAP TBC domain-containing protein n=1 Tax=Somion occarium TaxID=3059160 RepID=A0ABP1CG10_9APHY